MARPRTAKGRARETAARLAKEYPGTPVELCALHALIADFVVRKLLVLGCRRVAEVRRRVRKHRLLAEQQEQGEQQVHQSTAGVHGTCNIR